MQGMTAPCIQIGAKGCQTMILFVCTGNTCRSVAAELLARKLWENSGCSRAVFFTSAGLSAVPGAKASAPLRSLLMEEGIDAGAHRATPLEEHLVRRARLILVMTEGHRLRLSERFPGTADKVFLLKEYTGLSGISPEIEDPYGYPEKYREMVEEIRRAVAKLVGILSSGNVPPGGGF